MSQAYGRDLAEAYEWCKKYKYTSNVKDLTQAWELYYHVFRRISKQLPQVRLHCYSIHCNTVQTYSNTLSTQPPTVFLIIIILLYHFGADFPEVVMNQNIQYAAPQFNTNVHLNGGLL